MAKEIFGLFKLDKTCPDLLICWKIFETIREAEIDAFTWFDFADKNKVEENMFYTKQIAIGEDTLTCFVDDDPISEGYNPITLLRLLNVAIETDRMDLFRSFLTSVESRVWKSEEFLKDKRVDKDEE